MSFDKRIILKKLVFYFIGFLPGGGERGYLLKALSQNNEDDGRKSFFI